MTPPTPELPSTEEEVKTDEDARVSRYLNMLLTLARAGKFRVVRFARPTAGLCGNASLAS
jgi:hypothetical protein